MTKSRSHTQPAEKIMCFAIALLVGLALSVSFIRLNAEAREAVHAALRVPRTTAGCPATPRPSAALWRR